VALFPIEFLAVSAAVQSFFALRAPFVLLSLTFRCRTVAAQVEQCSASFVLFCVLHIFFQFCLLFKPLNWSVVDPRVNKLNISSFNLLFSLPFRVKSVAWLVLLLLAKHIKSWLQVFVDQVNCSSCFKFLFFIPFFSLISLVIFESPESSFSKDWS
jgi:hypothetical protein